MRSAGWIAATLALTLVAVQSMALDEKAENYLESGKAAQRTKRLQ